jgi:hypothetical protein
MGNATMRLGQIFSRMLIVDQLFARWLYLDLANLANHFMSFYVQPEV